MNNLAIFAVSAIASASITLIIGVPLIKAHFRRKQQMYDEGIRRLRSQYPVPLPPPLQFPPHSRTPRTVAVFDDSELTRRRREESTSSDLLPTAVAVAILSDPTPLSPVSDSFSGGGGDSGGGGASGSWDSGSDSSSSSDSGGSCSSD